MMGATVIVACRSEQRAREVCNTIKEHPALKRFGPFGPY